LESKESERLVYPKALKCFKSTKESIGLFNDLLKKNAQQDQTDFYKARKFLREGEDFYKQALKNAQRLLGPLPEYVTSDYKKWRKDLLQEYKMIAENKEKQELLEELLGDEFLNKLMSQDKVKIFLDLNYDSQQEGKRNLSNIKIRIVFNKLKELIEEAKQKQKKILEQK
jgi:hypothetical protein